MKAARVLVLSEGGRRQASAEHRVYRTMRRLELQGARVHVIAGRLRRLGRSVVWWVGLRCLWSAWIASREADVLIIHRTSHLGVALLCQLVRRRRRIPVVFDFDDAIHLPWRAGLPHPLYGGLRWTLRQAAVAWCGSHALCEFAARYTTALWIPTGVAEPFQHVRPRGTRPPTIVWMGNGPVHVASLALLARPLRRLAAVTPFRLRILSALGDPTVRSLFTELAARVDVDFGFDSWQSLEVMAAAVAECDVSVMPLVDTAWSRGKCAIKALESMAAGLPVVCSAVGENLVVAGEGEYALLARDERDWYRALRALLSCPALRRHYGDRGRQRAIGSYSMDAVMERIESSLRSLSARLGTTPSGS